MKYLFSVIFLGITLSLFAQFAGVGAQWTSDKWQFSANLGYPYIIKYSGPSLWGLTGGVDFTTGGTTVSGLNLKPISVFYTSHALIFSKAMLVVGLDSGYNINLTHGNNGIILTPNLNIERSILFLKAGYDYNTFKNEGQFFVRVGLGVGLGYLLNRIQYRHTNSRRSLLFQNPF